MKRRNFFRSLLIIGAASIVVPSILLQENDDDRLDRMVGNGDHIVNEKFYLRRYHRFDGMPCFIDKCEFYSNSNEICIYVNNGSIVTNSYFNHTSVKCNTYINAIQVIKPSSN
jgi:hypothetical protein